MSEEAEKDYYPGLTLEQAKTQLDRLYGRISRLETAVRIAGTSQMSHEEVALLLRLAAA